MGLDRGYVRRVLGWPKTKEGALSPPQRKAIPPSPREQLRQLYVMRGYPLHRIDALVEERLKDGGQARGPQAPR